MAPAGHGVRALTRVRPAGLAPLASSAAGERRGTCAVSDRLSGSSTSAPVSHADRRNLDFWEVAASAGIPSLSVGWWAAGPWPGATVVENRAVFARASDGAGGRPRSDRRVRDRGEKGLRALDGVPARVRHRAWRSGRETRGGKPDRRAASKRKPRVPPRARSSLVVLAADCHPREGSLGRLVVFDGARRRKERAESVRRTRPRRSWRGRAFPRPAILPGRPVPALFSAGHAGDDGRRRRTGRASHRTRRRRPRATRSIWRS